ncbi:MAG: Fic family protein [Salibacteraceae bacterium]|nr:Fic family protein [Salibacteraceae bacterium]MDP4963924.1 Fic family protein [Salibacteraceae bacterium]
MELLPIAEINVDPSKIKEVEQIMKSTFRLITYSRQHLADDLLNTYLTSTTNLQELLSIKNAQMEAQDDEEAKAYVALLNETLLFVANEIKNQVDFNDQVQLFQLFRLISPESHASHPNSYRKTLVQIGNYLCPDPKEIAGLVSELFYNLNTIKNPVIRAIYFHHELIRIHPFIDGNGRTTRIAKNWILMYNLYPPIFIRDEKEKSSYVSTLSNSFALLDRQPKRWNDALSAFFDQELDRLRFNSLLVYNSVKQIGETRQNEQ